MTSTDFSGLCFPVARVRYAGPTDTRGARWLAKLERDGTSYRAMREYDHALPSGSAQAVLAAQDAYLRARGADGPDVIAIPGDLSSDEYVFTFVPAELLGAK